MCKGSFNGRDDVTADAIEVEKFEHTYLRTAFFAAVHLIWKYLQQDEHFKGLLFVENFLWQKEQEV